MIAKLAEKAGADAIAIHPRTKKEMFEGKSN
jgi:tRNA-dihydrouridine synthase